MIAYFGKGCLFQADELRGFEIQVVSLKGLILNCLGDLGEDVKSDISSG